MNSSAESGTWSRAMARSTLSGAVLMFTRPVLVDEADTSTSGSASAPTPDDPKPLVPAAPAKGLPVKASSASGSALSSRWLVIVSRSLSPAKYSPASTKPSRCTGSSAPMCTSSPRVRGHWPSSSPKIDVSSV